MPLARWYPPGGSCLLALLVVLVLRRLLLCRLLMGLRFRNIPALGLAWLNTRLPVWPQGKGTGTLCSPPRPPAPILVAAQIEVLELDIALLLQHRSLPLLLGHAADARLAYQLDVPRHIPMAILGSHFYCLEALCEDIARLGDIARHQMVQGRGEVAQFVRVPHRGIVAQSRQQYRRQVWSEDR